MIRIPREDAEFVAHALEAFVGGESWAQEDVDAVIEGLHEAYEIISRVLSEQQPAHGATPAT